MNQNRTVSLLMALAAGVVFALPVQAGYGGRQLSAMGVGHSLAVRQDGSVWAWGANTSGQLGTGGALSYFNTPQPVAGLDGAVSVAAGWTFSVVLGSDGQVRTFGENNYGQLGDGSTTASPRSWSRADGGAPVRPMSSRTVAAFEREWASLAV